MAAPLFTLITELQVCIRRDFPLTDPTILNPLNANPLVEGEWLELDSSYLLKRGSGEGLNAAVFPVHTERGRYDTQAIGKANVIFAGMYEAETLVHPADLSAGGYVIGAPLTVQDVTVGGLTRRGLALSGGTDERTVVGFITKFSAAPSASSAAVQVRFVHFGNQKISVV
jgi:hypothetical protein